MYQGIGMIIKIYKKEHFGRTDYFFLDSDIATAMFDLTKRTTITPKIFAALRLMKIDFVEVESPETNK